MNPDITLTRRVDKIVPDSRRVLLRLFMSSDPQRIVNIIGRALSLTEEETATEYAVITRDFKERHLDLESILMRHYARVKPHIFTGKPLSKVRQLFIGALFTGEYSLESAALFNPSIVPDPDQSGLPEGALRFILSLRAVGEGHISSITFRSGVIDAGGLITVDKPSRHVVAPDTVPNPTYDKNSFTFKLHEMGFDNAHVDSILEQLGETFSLADLDKSVAQLNRRMRRKTHEEVRTLECVRWLAESNYEVSFSPKVTLSERIIFPMSANESNGIEDARFVRFVDDDGKITYYATYTAYNGHVILPQLIETENFLHFRVRTLNGRAVQNKGMALFPRRINGRCAMISRQDDENLFIMFSDNPHFWNDPVTLLRPTQPWEFVKIGNCGSPIETEAGWLVITHGVGAMRRYCIGAILLDLNDPTRIIGHLKDPLISPAEAEREGYVPNVVYTCGAMLNRGELVIPYAISDSMSCIATVPLKELIGALQMH